MSGRDRGPTGLRRVLGLPSLAIYGIGGMLGGGIYALTGEVAGESGRLAWLSFLVAAAVAAPTAFSYAALASRLPRAGGEAAYCRAAFPARWPAQLVGWLVVCSGIASVATLSHAFTGYLATLARWPEPAVIVAFLGLLATVNLVGIRITSGVNVAFTAVEVSGLLLVVAAGAWILLGSPTGEAAPAPPTGTAPAASGGVLGVLAGAGLAFYAFIGFEDMVNVAEEVRRPRRTIPLAIPFALGVVLLTYVAVAGIATATVPVAALAASTKPLEEVVARGFPALPPEIFSVIALFAVANSALLNLVMASRLLYGMATEGLLPEWLGSVHGRFRTPHRAVGVVVGFALVFALSRTLSELAGTTSLLLLVVFATVHVALLRIRRAEPDDPEAFTIPAVVPWVGIAASLGLALFVEAASVITAALAAALGGALILVVRARPG